MHAWVKHDTTRPGATVTLVPPWACMLTSSVLETRIRGNADVICCILRFRPSSVSENCNANLLVAVPRRVAGQGAGTRRAKAKPACRSASPREPRRRFSHPTATAGTHEQLLPCKTRRDEYVSLYELIPQRCEHHVTAGGRPPLVTRDSILRWLANVIAEAL
jgi:hypothetical protein